MPTRTFESLAISGEIDEIYLGGTSADNKVVVFSDLEAIKNNTDNIFSCTNNSAYGWYTIATNTDDRAVGRFGIRNRKASRHGDIIFYASAYFGLKASINILSYTKFSQPFIDALRIKKGGTYDGAVLQAHIAVESDLFNDLDFYILGDNIQIDGWVGKSWIPDADDPGGVANYALLNEITEIGLSPSNANGISSTHSISGQILNAGYDRNSYNQGELYLKGSFNGSTTSTLNSIYLNAYDFNSEIDVELGYISTEYNSNNSNLTFALRNDGSLNSILYLDGQHSSTFYGDLNVIYKPTEINTSIGSLKVLGKAAGKEYVESAIINLSNYNPVTYIEKVTASIRGKHGPDFDEGFLSLYTRKAYDNSMTETIEIKPDHTTFIDSSVSIWSDSQTALYLSGGPYAGALIEFYPIVDNTTTAKGYIGFTSTDVLTLSNNDTNGQIRLWANDGVLINNKLVAHAEGDEEWSLVSSLLNGWQIYGPTVYPVRYKKDQIGTVFIEGLIKNGTIATDSTGYAFLLPEGYRPSKNLIFNCMGRNATTVRVDVKNTGYVNIAQSTDDTSAKVWTSLANISFKV
jgi:hypothetical protein